MGEITAVVGVHNDDMMSWVLVLTGGTDALTCDTNTMEVRPYKSDIFPMMGAVPRLTSV